MPTRTVRSVMLAAYACAEVRCRRNLANRCNGDRELISGVPAVAGEGGHRAPKPLVAGPAEADVAVLAGFLGDGGDAGQGVDGGGSGMGLAAVAPLGEHLGGVDLTRPWQRREDLPVPVHKRQRDSSWWQRRQPGEEDSCW